MKHTYLTLFAVLLSFIVGPAIAEQPKPQAKEGVTTSMKQTLVNAALAERVRAYAPYSKYKVGAALLTKSGQIITGSNVENASYGLTICAERSAFFKAISEGHREFQMIAVVTKDGGYSCGACRQVINEFSPDLIIIIANESGEIIAETTLSKLLPHSFGPTSIK